MSAPSSSVRRLAIGVLGLGVLALGACSTAAADMTPVTVTVTPPEPTERTSAEPTPVPTQQAGGTGESVRAGHLTGAPASYAESASRVEAARIATSVQGRFLSPTGNIFCDVIRDGSAVACEIAEGRVDAPPGVCGTDGSRQVRRLELTFDRVEAVCGAGSIRDDAAASGAPKLRYGYRTIVAGTPIQCLSEKTGVTCIDTAGQRGYFLAKGTFALF